jgi:mannose-6-phosphate isomerase
LVAEIQQSSDTTYRLYDWGRLGADGRPRPLHVQQALGAIDFARGPVEPQQPRPTRRPDVERLVECEKFVLDRCRVGHEETLGGDQRCHILSVVEGAVQVDCREAGRGSAETMRCGETVLVPACAGEVTLLPAGGAVVLDAYLP